MYQLTGHSYDSKHHTQRINVFPWGKWLIPFFSWPRRISCWILGPCLYSDHPPGSLCRTVHCLWQDSTERLPNLSKVTELVQGEARTHTQLLPVHSLHGICLATTIFIKGDCAPFLGDALYQPVFLRVTRKAATLLKVMLFLPQASDTVFGLHTTLFHLITPLLWISVLLQSCL